MSWKKQVNKHGQIYLVGGAVRDMLLHSIHGYTKKSKDIDILVTGIEICVLQKLLSKYGIVKEAGKAFGVLIFKPHGAKMSYDIALPRKEVSIGPGYRDFDIQSDPHISVEEDLSRRDATINAIALKVEDVHTTYIDPHGGIADIKAKIWRTVGDPYKRFLEDPTRMLRAVRQCAELGLELETGTHYAIKEHKDLLDIIRKQSPVRLTQEFVRILKSDVCYPWISYIFDVGVAPYIGLKSVGDFDAIKRTSNHIARLIILLNSIPDLDVKKWTVEYELSAAPAFSKQYTQFVILACEVLFQDMFANNDIAMRKVIQHIGNRDHMPIFLKIVHSLYPHNTYTELYEVNKHVPLSATKIALSGHLLIELGIKGRRIGEVKQKLFEEITLGNIINKESDLLDYVKRNIDTL